MVKILITGGAGFIGHHLVEHILKTTDWKIVLIDRLNYASHGFDRLREIGAYKNRRVEIHTHDITQKFSVGLLKEIGEVRYIAHLAAETHVDNSIEDPEPFVVSNVLGTFRMLETARLLQPEQMVYFSTDEVFGPAPPGVCYKEWDRYNSTNPYSASKAGGEELCLAWANTYNVPVFITHTMNAFGERQHGEKFIPSTIRKVLNNEVVTIHSDPTQTVSGSRFYIHARNIASAVLFLLEHATTREKYNVVGDREVTNLELAEFIAECLKRTLRYDMVDFHSSRPGHDLRYALDGSRLESMGFRYPKSFEASLEKVIRWTVNNEGWIKAA
jgi:dTDP-glucose 4,6-dehydratase